MRSWIRTVVLGVGAFSLAGCGSESYRYRVTIDVDTPQGMRSGSSVWETEATEGSGVPDTARRVRNRGEAVEVDLPEGPMFALLRDDEVGADYPHYVVVKHLTAHPNPAVKLTPRWQQAMAAIREGKPSFDLHPDEYPLLVRFRDIKDTATVEQVDHLNPAASLGAGVSIRRITVSVTNDRVTRGIRDRLSWLSRHPEPSLEPNYKGSVNPTLVQKLRHGDFVRE